MKFKLNVPLLCSNTESVCVQYCYVCLSFLCIKILLFQTWKGSKALTEPPQPPIDRLRSLGRLPSAPDDRVITLGVSRLVEAR